jgi:hypothetical protein
LGEIEDGSLAGGGKYDERAFLQNKGEVSPTDLWFVFSFCLNGFVDCPGDILCTCWASMTNQYPKEIKVYRNGDKS